MDNLKTKWWCSTDHKFWTYQQGTTSAKPNRKQQDAPPSRVTKIQSHKWVCNLNKIAVITHFWKEGREEKETREKRERARRNWGRKGRGRRWWKERSEFLGEGAFSSFKKKNPKFHLLQANLAEKLFQLFAKFKKENLKTCPYVQLRYKAWPYFFNFS